MVSPARWLARSPPASALRLLRPVDLPRVAAPPRPSPPCPAPPGAEPVKYAQSERRNGLSCVFAASPRRNRARERVSRPIRGRGSFARPFGTASCETAHEAACEDVAMAPIVVEREKKTHDVVAPEIDRSISRERDDN
jgi:hypothetical protein